MSLLRFAHPVLALTVLAGACGGDPFTSGGDAGSGSSSGGSGGSSGGGSGGSSGGSSSSGGGGSSSGANDASVGDGSVGDASKDAIALDGPTCANPATRCGSKVCDGTNGQQGSICCVSPAPAFSCASCDCGCETQLSCALSADCGTGEECCISQLACSTGGQHWVSSCVALGKCTGQRLCNPGGTGTLECPGSATTTCSADTSAVGIPPSTGYGVCK